MILLIDNYDSFSYNLYQLIGELEPDIRVVRNDQYTPQELEQMNPTHIILSPGREDLPMPGSVRMWSVTLRERFRSLACALVIRQSAKPMAAKSFTQRS